MNSKMIKLCRYLAGAVLVLDVLSKMILGAEVSSIYGVLNLVSYASSIMIAVALFTSNGMPVIIGCGMNGFVSAVRMIYPILIGVRGLSLSSVILNISTAVCYILIAVSLFQKKSDTNIISIAIIIGIAGSFLYTLSTFVMDDFALTIWNIASSMKNTISTYIYLLMSILMLDEKNMPISAKNLAVPSSKNPIERVTKLKELLDSGAITQEEFDAKKKQLLGL